MPSQCFTSCAVYGPTTDSRYAKHDQAEKFRNDLHPCLRPCLIVGRLTPSFLPSCALLPQLPALPSATSRPTPPEGPVKPTWTAAAAFSTGWTTRLPTRMRRWCRSRRLQLTAARRLTGESGCTNDQGKSNAGRAFSVSDLHTRLHIQRCCSCWPLDASDPRLYTDRTSSSPAKVSVSVCLTVSTAHEYI